MPSGSTPKRIRALIVDDEVLARQRIEDLLRTDGGFEIVAQASSGDSAIHAIREWKPDLVFLDVQMPGKSGLDVVREIGAAEMPPTIFVTAFDQHALTAFDLAALDYLVKPFDDERFEQALQRGRRAIELEQVGRLSEQLIALLQGTRTMSPTGQSAAPHADYLERIAVEMKGQVRVVPVKQVDYIVASGPYAELYVGDKRYVIRERMQTLEERLDPGRFFRIHRSAIVRLDLVETLLRNPGGDYAVQLRGGVKLKVSRSRFEALEQRLSS
jgi:two-component system, LytTR family, response regulator